MTDLLSNTLSARGSRYGDFADNAKIADEFIYIAQGHAMDTPTNWHRLDATKRQALVLIFQKIARILSPAADPEYRDNWHDVQGYAKLAEDRCIVDADEPVPEEGDSHDQ